MPKFEYLFIEDYSTVHANDLGAEGWELVTVTLDSKGYKTYFFKRELVVKADGSRGFDSYAHAMSLPQSGDFGLEFEDYAKASAYYDNDASWVVSLWHKDFGTMSQHQYYHDRTRV